MQQGMKDTSSGHHRAKVFLFLARGFFFPSPEAFPFLRARFFFSLARGFFFSSPDEKSGVLLFFAPKKVLDKITIQF